MTRVSIIGTGYVGLVTGACLAARGHRVTCVDVDRGKVERINRGEVPIHEQGLDVLVRDHVGSRLVATTDIRDAVLNTDLTLIAVGTPASEGRIDLRFVLQVAGEIGAVLGEKAGYHVVAVKSTVVPGTTDGPVRTALERASGKRAGTDFGLGMNPEFLTEGTAVRDFSEPDRIVLGGIDARSIETLGLLYESFSAHVPRIRCNCRTAEFIKYASNALLATMISFANELSRLAMAVGDVDLVDVMKGVHESSYLTLRSDEGCRRAAGITSFLSAGCGFGGSCLPKDVLALAAQGEGLGVAMPLLRAVLDINRTQPREVLALLERELPSLRGTNIAVLGIAFKPDTDDTRESPALPIMRLLEAAGANLVAFDPLVDRLPANFDVRARTAASLQEAVQGVDAVVIVTRWAEFETLPALLFGRAPPPLVVDGRRMLDPHDVKRYAGIGRGLR